MRLKQLHEATTTAGIAVGAIPYAVKHYKKKKKVIRDFLKSREAQEAIIEKKEPSNSKMYPHKTINVMKKVWQPVDYERSKKKRWYNQYAADTSIKHPYASMGI